MKIYSKTSTAKKYVGGVLIGVLLLPAIYLFTKGFIVYGIVILITYLAFETMRTGVHFDQKKIKFFREFLFFIKIPRAEDFDLNVFSHYRIDLEHSNASVSANWVQASEISQELYVLNLFDQNKGEFLQIVKSDLSQIQPILSLLEEQQIVLAD